MTKPYIVQHALFQNRERKGIDGILVFAYMGSSEYEFGAMKKSLDRIRISPSTNGFEDFEINGKPITIYGRKNKLPEIQGFIVAMSKKEYKFKCRSLFADYIADIEYEYETADFWWDLENDFMFWKHNDEFEESFIGVI